MSQKTSNEVSPMCQHDYTQPIDTLTILPVRRMVSPPTYILQCQCCGQILTVKQSEIERIKEFIIKHTS